METTPRLSAPPTAETQFDRGAWLTLLGVLGFVAFTLSMTVVVLRRPADGWLVPYDADPLYADFFFGDWPTPLRAGDVFGQVAGKPIDLMYSLQDAASVPVGWWAGETVEYVIERGGVTGHVLVTLHTPTWPQVLRALAHTATADLVEWSWPLIALVVFWRRPRSHAARLLLMAMSGHAAITKLGWATTSISLYTAPTGLVLLVQFVTNFWMWLFWPTIIWLVLSFPQPVWPLTRQPRLVPALLYGVPLVAVSFTLLTGVVAPVLITLVSELALLLLALVLAAVTADRPGSNAVARAQASWVLLGLGLSLGLVLALYVLEYYLPGSVAPAGWVITLVTLALPVCLGVAILRYRLFDINVIIRRTLQYAVLTIILALVYGGLVVVLESVVRPLTGQGQNQGAMVLSTLAMAALFGPLRRRVQTAIDRRFDRRHYDAARTLAAFGADVKAETDLVALRTI